MIDITHYTSYNKYIKELKEESNEVSNGEVRDSSYMLKESIKINTVDILIHILTVVPRKIRNKIIDLLRAYITGRTQRDKEHPLLAELCNIIIHQETFGIKYEVR